MNKYVLVLMTGMFFYGMAGHAQSVEVAPGDSLPWEFRKQSFIYNTAKYFQDKEVVKMALYNLISENPQNPSLYDSLALLYFNAGQNLSAALVADQSLNLQPENPFALRVAAISYDNVGVKDKALSRYEKLYLLQTDVNIMYTMAFLQLNLQRLKEASVSIDIVINDPDATRFKRNFPTSDKKGQEVSLQTAAYRMKAMIEERKQNKEGAKELYKKALELSPGFEVVIQQLQLLSSK